MGHEYVELCNTNAAVGCYRQAISVSQSDYRAWYGLGQTYEMLHMYQYALYYFKVLPCCHQFKKTQSIYSLFDHYLVPHMCAKPNLEVFVNHKNF